MTLAAPVRIGTAGWALPPAVQKQFPPGDSHLQRYARTFNACEINASFHRLPRAGTWERWGRTVPADFLFSAKLPKAITHERRLVQCEAELAAFFESSAPMAERLGCVLVQLPPSLAFDESVTGGFLAALQRHRPRAIALEPRHASWFTDEVDAWLAQRRVARVLADPVLHAGGERPGGWAGLAYLRLHGSPRTYYSSYNEAWLARLAARIAIARDAGQDVWCMFDNTAGQAAAGNAMVLRRLLAQT